VGVLSFFNLRSKTQDSLGVEGDHLVFIGGAKYNAIPMDLIESIIYEPREETWQEISIKQTGKSAHNYYLNSDIEQLKKAVVDINNTLEPVQPICKFIMSATQGAFSGKD